ncbi:sulfite exporter TauE/SafE family protein [Sporosarcina sp. ANT_H38]|uniref:cytochrome c biogenesis CcdA family protein n=1 Tax=Sporosarcina sp. ANT_H38 TaxID=2597358 RepID=UPI0011F3B9B8|nr:sulfite exporter TauE/SafE family protein [Sporosarcina sp. ANT_H38]KAA0965309.1 sulfite exporter TauE/SafE family protein [Sporosarcina sp. ANT_H38]
MYGMMSKISGIISEPLTILVHSFADDPLIYTLLLGIIGAVAPCQLTGNMSAITFYGNRTVQMKNDWVEVLFFIIGKVVVFSSLGLLTWLLGQSFETKMTEYFPLFRKVIGPLIITTGLVLLGVLKLEILQRITLRIPMQLREGKVGSFLLGASFSLAFCPTMFVIFFLWLMSAVVTTSYGFVLPAVFGIATSLPLLLLFLLIWLFDAKRLIMKRSIKVGRVIQRFAGVVLVILGVLDTITYWGI